MEYDTRRQFIAIEPDPVVAADLPRINTVRESSTSPEFPGTLPFAGEASMTARVVLTFVVIPLTTLADVRAKPPRG